MPKPLVFISHITEEQTIAEALKAVLEPPFIGMMDVFVSSDPKSIRLGNKWRQEITDALKRCAVEIVIASPESVKRPWVNFEAGAVWIRERPIISLCHSGMEPGKLPTTLSELRAANASNGAELQMMVPTLADALGSETPTIDFGPFIEVVKQFESDLAQNNALVAQTPLAPTAGLAPHELITFVTIADNVESPIGAVAIGVIQEVMAKAGYRSIAMTMGLKALERKHLIELGKDSDDFGHEYTVVSLSNDGWTWLEANQHVVELIPMYAAPEESTNTNAGDDIPF